MKNQSGLNRRRVLAGQACLLVLAGTTGTASATTGPHIKPSTSDRRVSDWSSIDADELSTYVGQEFQICADDCGTRHLRLASVESTVSGPDRPASLQRKEGFIATFEGADAEALVEAGHRTYTMKHDRLAQADLFMGPTTEEGGRHSIVLVVN